MMETMNAVSTSLPTLHNLVNLSSNEEQKLQPLLCLPAQFFTDAIHSEAHWNGTRRLLFAVLQDAVACWFRYRHSRSSQGQQQFREIRDWFLTKDQDSLYAFESICTHLNLDADYFRRGLIGQDTPQCHAEWVPVQRPGRLTRRRS
jgi:hypothetical protein